MRGRLPDPSALRRDRPSDGPWVSLPAAGRQGPAPAWPLTRATGTERALWAREWRRPQAVMWETNRQELEVALYVRSAVEASERHASASLRLLVLRQAEGLGISHSGLLRNRWIIAELPEAPVRPSAPSSRLRLMQDTT